MRTCKTCLRDGKGLKCPIKDEITTDCCDYYRGYCQRKPCFWTTTRFFKDKLFSSCLLDLDGGWDDCECWTPPWSEVAYNERGLEKQRRMIWDIGKTKREDSDYQEEMSRLCRTKRSNISDSCHSIEN